MASPSPSSCLPSDAFSHFEQREQELLALNQELDRKKKQAIEEASNAVRGAGASSLHSRALLRPPEELSDGPDVSLAPAMSPVAAAATAGAAELLAALPGRPPMIPATSSSSRPGSAFGAGASGAGGVQTLSGANDIEALHTTIRFQNARVIALQEELDKTIAELTARDNDAQQLRQDLRQAQDENRKLQKSSSAAEQAQEKLKKQFAAAEGKLRDLEKEKSELQKDKDQLDLQRRKAEAESGTKDARINRLAEESERYKATLKDVQFQEKDKAIGDRRETDRLTAEVRKLERQRAELVAAFKKQMRLIDVLKRQRAHVEAARVLSFTEEEFIRVLELGEKLGE